MRFLADLKMVKLVRTEPRRGAVEHYYEALEPPLISDDDWAQLPVALRRSLSDSTLGNIANDLRGAAAEGGFDRPNIHITRTALTLDEQGWDELSGALADVLERARRIQEDSNKRRKRADAGSIPTALVLMQFEGGAPRPPSARAVPDTPVRALSPTAAPAANPSMHSDIGGTACERTGDIDQLVLLRRRHS